MLGPIAFSVSDDITDASNLVVSGRTEAYWLIPEANIVMAGSGATRTVTITPVPGASGTATIVLTVSDGAFSTARQFQVTITPLPRYGFAEGATGTFFETDLLLLNPNTEPVDAQINFMKDDGTSITQVRTLPPSSRVQLRAKDVAGLEAAAFSQYWPNPAWHESHVSQGVRAPGVRWSLAEGQVGGPANHQTYVLLANCGTTVADVAITRHGRRHSRLRWRKQRGCRVGAVLSQNSVESLLHGGAILVAEKPPTR